MAKGPLTVLAGFFDDVTGRMLGFRNPVTLQDDLSSGRTVTALTTLAVTEVLHEGREVILSLLAGFTSTLPASVGLGAKYRFKVGIVVTSNSYIIKVANATDIIQGTVAALSDGSNAMLGWIAGAADDTITLNHTTTGGASIGDWIELQDIKLGVWAVTGIITQTGTEATPFSSTV